MSSLRHDPLMAMLAGKTDPAPQEGFALAGKSTLNPFERTSNWAPGDFLPAARTRGAVSRRQHNNITISFRFSVSAKIA